MLPAPFEYHAPASAGEAVAERVDSLDAATDRFEAWLHSRQSERS